MLEATVSATQIANYIFFTKRRGFHFAGPVIKRWQFMSSRMHTPHTVRYRKVFMTPNKLMTSLWVASAMYHFSPKQLLSW